MDKRRTIVRICEVSSAVPIITADRQARDANMSRSLGSRAEGEGDSASSACDDGRRTRSSSLVKKPGQILVDEEARATL